MIEHQVLADLRWLLLSPALVNAQHPRFTQRVFEFDLAQRALIEQWLDQQAQDPSALMAWLASKSERHLARLGRYAEQLLEFFLRNGPTHRLIEANIALRVAPSDRRGDHTTLGEIDYLLEDEQGQRWHWELAVKYFLCRPVAQPTTADLIGPDAAETFDSKLDKMFERQLRQVPPAPHDQHSWRPAAFTRGWMFYPQAVPSQPVAELNPEHLQGQWITLAQLQAQADSSEEHFHILDRQRWLARAKRLASEPAVPRWLSARALATTIEHRWSEGHASGVLVAQMGLSGNHAVEIRRFFVVPNTWPENANAVKTVNSVTVSSK